VMRTRTLVRSGSVSQPHHEALDGWRQGHAEADYSTMDEIVTSDEVVSTALVQVPVAHDDLGEPRETVGPNLGVVAPGGARMRKRALATLTILDVWARPVQQVTQLTLLAQPPPTHLAGGHLIVVAGDGLQVSPGHHGDAHIPDLAIAARAAGGAFRPQSRRRSATLRRRRIAMPRPWGFVTSLALPSITRRHGGFGLVASKSCTCCRNCRGPPQGCAESFSRVGSLS
jgi:hypothetical protein